MPSTEAPQDLEQAYEAGLRRYLDGDPLGEVLADFEALARLHPRDPRLVLSLSWLYTLEGHKEPALQYAKLARTSAQGRFNQVLAMLTFGEKGVRDRFEEAYHSAHPDEIQDAIDNLNDALARKGGQYPAATKMLDWLQHHHL